MEELKVQLVDDALLVEDFIRLKLATGFMNRPLNQIEDALKNGLFNVSAIYIGKVIGMGRLIGDGAMYWYLQDISILPEYQRKGIGKCIVNRLIEHIENTAIPNTCIEVGLSAVKGKEAFYEKLGFSLGSSGMTKRIDVKSGIS